MLIEANEAFQIRELESRELRRFQILQEGKNCGIIYEDQLDPKVLRSL